jgi:hypothetical protein
MRKGIAGAYNKVIVSKKRDIVADTGKESFYFREKIFLGFFVKIEINLEARSKIGTRSHLHNGFSVRIREGETDRGIHRDLFTLLSPILHQGNIARCTMLHFGCLYLLSVGLGNKFVY